MRIFGIGSNDSIAALNWPKNRGAATAFPLAAFGLSAFFFSTLSSWLFPGDTSSFLLVLAVATSATIFVSFFFLRVIHLPRTIGYTAIADSGSGSNVLHRTKSGESIPRQETEPGTASSSSTHPVIDERDPATLDETSSILSKSSEEEDLEAASTKHKQSSSVDGMHVDIRGLALLKEVDFWLLWFMLGLMTGCGLMTIKYVYPDLAGMIAVVVVVVGTNICLAISDTLSRPCGWRIIPKLLPSSFRNDKLCTSRFCRSSLSQGA